MGLFELARQAVPTSAQERMEDLLRPKSHLSGLELLVQESSGCSAALSLGEPEGYDGYHARAQPGNDRRGAKAGGSQESSSSGGAFSWQEI